MEGRDPSPKLTRESEEDEGKEKEADDGREKLEVRGGGLSALEELLPGRLGVACLNVITAVRKNRSFVMEVLAFIAALDDINAKNAPSAKVLSLVAQIISHELGIDTVKITSKWSATHLCEEAKEDKIKTNHTMVQIALAMNDFVNRVRQYALYNCENATRVYLWRDCFYPMVLDTLKNKLGGGAVGAVISRSTIGDDYYYYPNSTVINDSIQGMIAAASETSGGKLSLFVETLRGFIRGRRKADEGFNKACERVIAHLIQQGALKHDGKSFPQQSVLFIDTGYRTFPAFLKALVEDHCGEAVEVHIFYHTVMEDVSFFPRINVRKKGEGENEELAGMNDIGSYASFFKSGSTLDQRGILHVTHGNLFRIRDSIMFGLFLVCMLRTPKKK